MPFSIQVDGTVYRFQGPFTRNQLPDKSGVYMVMGDGGHPVYVGESATIFTRVNGNHERERCWLRHGTGNSIRCVLIPNAHTRAAVEAAAIRKWEPLCNRT